MINQAMYTFIIIIMLFAVIMQSAKNDNIRHELKECWTSKMPHIATKTI